MLQSLYSNCINIEFLSILEYCHGHDSLNVWCSYFFSFNFEFSMGSKASRRILIVQFTILFRRYIFERSFERSQQIAKYLTFEVKYV